MKPLEMIKKQRELFVLFDQYKESTDVKQRLDALDKADVLMLAIVGRGHGIASNDVPDVEVTPPAVTNMVSSLDIKAPNKNIILGFNGVNGISQPSINTTSDRLETIYTNTKNGTTLGIALNTFKGAINLDDVIINGDESLGKIKQRKANKKNLFDPVASKADIDRLEKAAALVADYVNSAFPLTYNGITISIDSDDDFYRVTSDNGSYADFPLSKIITDIDSGEAERKTNLTLDERLALLDEHRVGSNVLSTTITPANHGEDPMLEQYREGVFNDKSANDFTDVMIKVAELGMGVDEVKSGAIEWASIDEQARLVA